MCNRLAGGGPNYCGKSRNGAPSPPKAEVTSSNLVERASPIKLLRQTYSPTPPARRLPICRRPQDCHQSLRRRDQRQSKTVRLGRRSTPRPRRYQTWETSVGVGPLDRAVDPAVDHDGLAGEVASLR